jgi:hypothetical protein
VRGVGYRLCIEELQWSFLFGWFCFW